MPQKREAVFLPLECCDKCPHLDQNRWYTADSWEQVESWNCKHPKLKGKTNGRTDREKWESPPGIARQEAFDKPPPIPKWCPLRKTKLPKEK
jgi:hypothetical protein